MSNDAEHWLLRSDPYGTYESYLRAHGGSALDKARAMAPEDVVAEIGRAGLRGRGGAGFPTATKWRSIVEHDCPTRYAVCNAAEGEPGTFKDRYLLRRDPYSMLEGLLIAAHVANAEEAYVACKASFVRELARIRGAIDEMTAARALGGVKINVVEGPEEYLFGEEKALLEVCEGNDPLPREPHYPPYERGLFATQSSPNPAIVNNVETLARVPGILRAGAASFRAIGTADTPGPIIFTISGDVRKPGVFEAPAGIKLSQLFHELAGGPREGRTFKAALSGVSTLSIPASRFETNADHASLHMIGSGLGSAGFILFDELASMPRVTQAVARFLYVESCNQCPACKNGLRTASSAIDELFDAALATPDDFERAFYGAHRAPQGNRCYLPVQGSKLIPDLMKRFEAEFAAQLQNPSGAPDPYVIPKLVDFDEARGEFVYDELQPRKNPNWTYAPAPEKPSVPKMSVPEPRKAAKPARPVKQEGLQTISVRLMADVRAELAKVLKDQHNEAELDRVVNDALREWIRTRAARP
jgi:NADH-quinone oxidoreductase subunit F